MPIWHLASPSPALEADPMDLANINRKAKERNGIFKA